jgi:hypothetical protein
MLETDDGERIADKVAASRLVEDWDLDLDGLTWRVYFPTRHQPRKLVPPRITQKRGVETGTRVRLPNSSLQVGEPVSSSRRTDNYAVCVR